MPACVGIIDVYGVATQKRTLTLRPEKINAFLGADIPFEFMVKTLTALGFEVDTDKMEVSVPTYRADVEGEADLAEEIVRIYGYNKIESTLMAGELTKGGKNSKQLLEDKIKTILTSQGLNEILTYSFTDPAIFDKLCIDVNSSLRDVVRITNPLGEENSVMRTTMLGSMLEVLSHNYNQRNEAACLFEVGKIYFPRHGQKLPEEREAVSLGMYGADIDFYALKGVLEEFFENLGIVDYKFVPETDHPSFHPGRCCTARFCSLKQRKL